MHSPGKGLRAPRAVALATITILVAVSAIASFAESYRALYEWAIRHGLTGLWAAGFPAQIDVVIAIGELALFVALADAWSVRSRLAACSVTLIGMAVSVAGNVGHVAGHELTSRATAAIPPLAAAAALAVGLGVLKRVVAARSAAPESAPATAPVATARPRLAVASGSRSKVTPETRAERRYAEMLAAGELPSIRAIARDIKVGAPKAKSIRAHLATTVAA